MNYNDIEITLSRFKNYQIPTITKIMTNHIIRYPDSYDLFLNKSKNIDDLLSYIHQKFQNETDYTEEVVLKLTLEYFDINIKATGINHG